MRNAIHVRVVVRGVRRGAGLGCAYAECHTRARGCEGGRRGAVVRCEAEVCHTRARGRERRAAWCYGEV
jgi:hypothetical protein